MMAKHDFEGPEDKRRVFREICRQVHPVFRYFFLERFEDASTWLLNRTAYIQSLATNSILGYVVGLGDRHLQNILVDKHSCEIVHIDLNLIFDQAKKLRVPERVPFRLTRDLVDGMGPFGVEGMFRKSCEYTLEVLRDNSDTFLTLLEVFRHDPLCRWTISDATAEKLKKRGKEIAVAPLCDTGTTEADRVNLEVRDKLSGLVNGSALSVVGQVNYLIQQASDELNLASIYSGWEPWY